MSNNKRQARSRKASGRSLGAKNQSKLVSKTKKQIKTKEAYQVTMAEIHTLMKKGERNLSEVEMNRLSSLSEAAEIYEDTNDPLPLPSKLPEMIRMRMFQMHLNQSFAAKLLGVSDAKFSMIMNGRQKPDIYFIKALHEKLRVDGNQILSVI